VGTTLTYTTIATLRLWLITNLLEGISDRLIDLETSFKGMKISCVNKTCQQQNTSASSFSLEEIVMAAAAYRACNTPTVHEYCSSL